jgi:hypothetical protein
VAGGCTLLSKSDKHKVNTRSSTKAELIAVDDALPMIQLTKHFVMEQGYELNTIIKEDNCSTMILMKNGQLSAGKQTKHLDIRYFYVKDLINRGVMTLEHCVSDDTIADFFTKPLQGGKNQIFRDIILNYHRDNPSALQYRSELGDMV